jgi:hypothetical protein
MTASGRPKIPACFASASSALNTTMTSAGAMRNGARNDRRIASRCMAGL